jgi:RsiW-degrading membrane proteinase PrsW (M82 family)
LLTACLVYRYDLYEHEPVPLLAVAVAAGTGAMWTAGRVEAWLLAALAPVAALGVASVAAITEELAKLLVVVAVALLARREFDDPMDGIVYGSMAGLGAALEESLFYRRLGLALHTFVPAAELVRLWAHVVLGGIVGFPLGFWRAYPRRVVPGALAGLAAAAALHFSWDGIVLSVPDLAPPGPWHHALGLTLMIGSLILYGRLTVLASARSRRQFAPQSRLQLWGWPFDRVRRRWDQAASADPPKPILD